MAYLPQRLPWALDAMHPVSLAPALLCSLLQTWVMRCSTSKNVVLYSFFCNVHISSHMYTYRRVENSNELLWRWNLEWGFLSNETVSKRPHHLGEAGSSCQGLEEAPSQTFPSGPGALSVSFHFFFFLFLPCPKARDLKTLIQALAVPLVRRGDQVFEGPEEGWGNGLLPFLSGSVLTQPPRWPAMWPWTSLCIYSWVSLPAKGGARLDGF